MTTKANRIAAEAAAEYPGRIYGYISVAPSEGMDSLKQSIRQYGKDPAFVGLKFLGGYNGDYIEETYQYALGFANETRCPVLCHTWANNPAQDTLRGMMDAFPDFKLVCAHLGGGSEFWTRKAAVIANQYDHFYLEICGSLHNTLGIADVIDLVGARKIIYGSDVLNLDARYDFGRVAFAPISEADRERIFAGNFLGLLEDSQMGKIAQK
jgi:predicted TIM-barrel fold metal-dependent hydrolase